MTNFADRTIWAGDNLDILRGLNSASVDLIYLHPPFNSNQDYAAPVGSVAAGAAFKDTWTLSDLDVVWMGLIADEQPAMYKVLEAAGLTHGKGMQSYLCMMAVRLLEMRRVLKDSGSIYLHCDPTASHYLKLLMDSIYGDRNFRSEIIWKRTTAHNDGAQGRRQHGRVHDVLFFYTKSDQWTWNTIYTDYEPEYVARFSLIEPETNRRYTLDNLTGPGGASKGNPRYAVMGITRYWRYSEECMQQLIAAGRIVQSRPGAVPRYKRYLDEMPGLPLQDSWADIAPINSQAKERIGYPTQKPPSAPRAQHQGLINGFVTARTDIPVRTDIVKPVPYRQNKHLLFGQQEGRCNGCRGEFPFRVLEVDHVIPQRAGGQDNIENLQLLCAHCNRVKGDRPQEYLVARLRELGIAT